jgi:hypothetical protein
MHAPTIITAPAAMARYHPTPGPQESVTLPAGARGLKGAVDVVFDPKKLDSAPWQPAEILLQFESAAKAPG